MIIAKDKIKKYIIIFIFFILAIVGTDFFLNANTSKEVEKSYTADVSQPLPEFKYIMKDYNGKLAVFEIDKQKPKMVFDVLISTLPEIDILQLQQGLKIKDIDELNQRIEDFVS